MKFSIIIPCYNEAENLHKIIESSKNIFNEYDMELILVENGSKDNSRDILLNCKEIDNTKIKLVLVDENQGYGYGLIQGLKSASGDYVGWLHADLQYTFASLKYFFDYATSYCDETPLFMKGRRCKRKFVDVLFTKAMGVFETLLFKTHLYDISAIPVLFDKSLLNKINKAPYDFSIELFFYLMAKREKYFIHRHKVIQQARENGKSSWNTGFASRIKQSQRIITASKQIRKGEKVK